MRHTLLSLALAAVALGNFTPAAAQTGACPNGPAVDGVYVTYADRTVIYRRLSDGRTAELEIGFDGSYIYEYRSLPIGLIEASWELTNGRVPADDLETVIYEGLPLPLPTPGVNWSGTEVSTFTNGDQERYITSLYVQPQVGLSIGACNYVVYPIRVTRLDSTGVSVPDDALAHVPALGVTLFMGNPESSFEGFPDPPTGISLTPPTDGAVTPATPTPPATPTTPPTK